MKSISLLFCSICFATFCFAKPYPKEVIAKVVEVIDGNTVVVEDDEGEQWKVAFLYADAPEDGQEGFEEALKALRKRILKKKIRLKIEKKDRRGMLRGRFFLKKSDIEKEMLESGMAWMKPPGTRSLSQASEKAKREQLGIWSGSDPQPPWVWRRNITNQIAKGS